MIRRSRGNRRFILGAENLEDRTTPATMFAVTSTNSLLSFDSATPGTIASTNAITGLQVNEEIVGIDVRPATGQLYAMGLVDTGANQTARIYTINPATGAATPVGGAPWTTTFPDTTVSGFNFNPNVDLIRIIANTGENFRVSPVTGALVGTDTSTSQTGLNGVSYTNNDGFLATTTLFGLRLTNDTLVTVGGLNGTPSPNGGQVTLVGNTGVTSLSTYGFEIVSSGGVATAFATANANLFTVNLTTGAFTLVGAVGGAPVIRSLTAALPNTITVGGTANDDAVVVTATGVNSGSYTLNGGTAVAFSGLNSFSFIGGNGNDTLTINNGSGVFAPSNRVFFHGGAGTNTLVNSGGIATNGFLTPLNATDGTLTHVDGPDTQQVVFTSLTSITDTIPETTTFDVNGIAAADTINLVNGPVAGQVQVNSGTAPTFVTINLANKGSLIINTGAGDNTVTLNSTVGAAAVGDVFVQGGANNDTILVQATAVLTSIAAGDGTDVIRFAAGATLSGGSVNGETGTDTLDYTAYTTPVAVNLGLSVTGLSSTLGGGQEVTSNGSTAVGTATLSNYNLTNKTFDLTLTVTGLAPATVTGLHIHRGGVGVNGPVILDLLPLGTLVPVADGFTLTLTGLDLDNSLLVGAANEAAFLGGQTYLNIHTAAFPNGLIRGQIFATANANLTFGSATGTNGLNNIENVIGGSAADSLVGSSAANTLNGLAGNDILLGGPGSDTFLGGADDDVMIWSNGDGSDIMNGEVGNDTVAVNGNLTANDVFTIAANGSRVDFDRVSPGPFSLDIGTTETLRINGGTAGDETFTVSSLAGVADLAAVHLFGFAGSDTFTITPTIVPININGGLGTDTLTTDLTGTTNPFLTSATELAGGLTGSFAFSNRSAVNFTQTETTLPPENFLSVTLSDDLTTVEAGETTTYTLEVTNNSSVGLNGITVSDMFPAALTGITWTAVLSAGSTGATSGTGNINQLVNLAADGTVTYTITGTISAAFTGTLTNMATAATPSGLTDNSSDDNTATDTTTVTLPPPPPVSPPPPISPPPPASPPSPITPLVVAGTLNGTAQLFQPSNGKFNTTPTATLTPFGTIPANLRTATGDVDGDGVNDSIFVTGPGTLLRVAVISGSDNKTVLVAPFAPFAGSEDFALGGFVTSTDLDGDGNAEFIVTPDQGGGPRVTVFSLVDGKATVQANFFGIDDTNFRGGARAAAGDVNGDGTPDLVVSAGFSGGPRTALFNGTTIFGTPERLVGDFFAFPGSDAITLRNGVFVSAGDVDGDGFADLIFGGGPGGAPRVFILPGSLIASGKVEAAQASPIANFFVANNSRDRGGVRVATLNIDGDSRADLAVGSGESSPATARVYRGVNFTNAAEPTTFQDLSLFDGSALLSGVFVG